MAKDLNIKSVFDWNKHINQLKTDVTEFTTKDWDVFNSYVIHRIMSMNPDYLELVNEAQKLLPQNKKEIYSIYKEYIPRNNKWNKYIKSTTKQYNKDLVDHLSLYFEVSKREVKDYLKILDNGEILRILSNIGIVEKKEIKTLLK